MSIVNTLSMKNNRQITIYFDGGDLSSDTGLLLIKEFVSTLGIDTIRLKLLKLAAKAIHSARYITFKLCDSCPYKNEFYDTFSNIKLKVQLE